MVQPLIRETERECVPLRENQRGRVPRRVSGSQKAGDVLKQRNRGPGILLLRVLSENPAIGNKG